MFSCEVLIFFWNASIRTKAEAAGKEFDDIDFLHVNVKNLLADTETRVVIEKVLCSQHVLPENFVAYPTFHIHVRYQRLPATFRLDLDPKEVRYYPVEVVNPSIVYNQPLHFQIQARDIRSGYVATLAGTNMPPSIPVVDGVLDSTEMKCIVPIKVCIAAYEGNLRVVRTWLEGENNIKHIDRCCPCCPTSDYLEFQAPMIFFAAYGNNIDIIEYLIKKGATANVKGIYYSLLHDGIPY